MNNAMEMVELVFVDPHGEPGKKKIQDFRVYGKNGKVEYEEDVGEVVPGIPFKVSKRCADHLLGPAGTKRFKLYERPKEGSPPDEPSPSPAETAESHESEEPAQDAGSSISEHLEEEG